jgi:hypothetical protein
MYSQNDFNSMKEIATEVGTKVKDPVLLIMSLDETTFGCSIYRFSENNLNNLHQSKL